MQIERASARRDEAILGWLQRIAERSCIFGKYAAAEPIEKSHFEDPRPDADLKVSLISVISMIRRFY